MTSILSDRTKQTKQGSLPVNKLNVRHVRSISSSGLHQLHNSRVASLAVPEVENNKQARSEWLRTPQDRRMEELTGNGDLIFQTTSPKRVSL